MATNIKNRITGINKIKQAKYFSLIVDSTPDISHIDQLSFIIRYLDKENKIQERFLCFLHIEKHDANYLENIITLKLSRTILRQCSQHVRDIQRVTSED